MPSTYTRSRSSYARSARVNARPATDRQLSTLTSMITDARLLQARLTEVTDPADAQTLRATAQDHAARAVQDVRDSADRASDLISATSELLRSLRQSVRDLPAPAATLPTATTPTGDAPHTPAHRDVFRLADGTTVYRVQRSQSTGSLYALRLDITTPGEDATDHTWTFVPGGMRHLTGARLLTRDEALALSALITECVRCGRHLTASDSVARGIGPVCIKYFS